MVRRDLAIIAGVLSLTTLLAAYFAQRGEFAGHRIGQINALRVIIIIAALMLSFFLSQRLRELRWENRARIAAEETLRHQNGYLAALHTASVALMDRLAVEDVLATIVAQAGQLLDTRHGFIDLLVSDGIELEAKVGTGIMSRDRGVSVRRGIGLSGRVWETGEPVVVNDYEAWPYRLMIAPGSIRAAICVPLVSGGQFCGALGLAYDAPGRRFGEQEVTLLVRFAQLASIALDSARLYDAAQREIREREEAEARLRESEERYRRLVEQFPEAIVIHRDDRYVFVNDAAVALLGGSCPEDILGRSVYDFVLPEDAALVRERIELSYEGKNLPELTLYVRRRRLDGEIRFTEARGIPITFDGKPAVQVVYRDITERKHAEEQLLHTALHDTLTGLPNRALFMDRLREALGDAKHRPDTRFAVLFVDFDRFKNVNDSLGHVQGDRLLTELAQRLADHLDPICTIARLGGDEFAILMPEIADVRDATEIAEQLQEALAPPVILRGNEVFITASIGIAVSKSGYHRPEEILRDADTAMYRAKSLGAARYIVFDAAMHARVVAMLQLENDLRRAIERDEFQVLYQPIVSLTTGETTGFEALIRWQHPRLGLLTPTDFIALAEETGLILALDIWVMRAACRQMREWVTHFPMLPHFAISVNISGKQFAQADFLDRVMGILAETGLDARRLQIEITERALIGQAETAATALWQARAAGIQVQLDDFGIGYSSLSYLQQFPIDTLKIDRSFVSNEDSQAENTEIVRAIVTLAHNLNIRVTAEGIETAAQRAHLRDLLCDFGQGYYFSPPMNGAMVERLLAERVVEPFAAD